MVEIQTKIYNIRGVDVMLDSDIAELYEVETREVNQAVARKPPKAFTEQGVYILATILKGDAAADAITILEEMILEIKAAKEVESIGFLRSEP